MSVSDDQAQRQLRFSELLTEEAYQLAWRYCCALAASTADAEDLLHDALYRALRRIDQVRDVAAFRSWLVAIVRTTFLNGLRRKRVEQQGQALLAQPVVMERPSAQAEITAAALARLPDEQRQLLTLFYLEGFSLRELATALGLRPLVVQGRLARSREALRREVLRVSPVADIAQRSEGHG